MKKSPENMRQYQLTTKDAGSVHHLHARTYVPQFASTMHQISDIIASTDLSFGLHDTMLDGYLLAKPGHTRKMEDVRDGVYIYDLVIHPWRRGEGLSSWLLEEFFKETRKRGLDIFFHCHRAAYPLVDNRKLERFGYKIVEDTFIQDFYKQWGVDESANYLHLKPMENTR